MLSKSSNIYDVLLAFEIITQIKLYGIGLGFKTIRSSAVAWFDLVTCTIDDSHADVAGVYYYRFLYYLLTCNDLQIVELGIG